MSSSNIDWEALFKHRDLCSQCGNDITFSGFCEDCTGTSDYVDEVLGT